MYQVWFPLRSAAYVDLAKRNAENMVHKRVLQQTTDERPLPARGMEKIEEAVEERVYRTGYSREQQQALVGWKEGDYGIELGGGGAPAGDVDEPPPHPALLLHHSSVSRQQLCRCRPAALDYSAGGDGGRRRHPLSLVSLGSFTCGAHASSSSSISFSFPQRAPIQDELGCLPDRGIQIRLQVVWCVCMAAGAVVVATSGGGDGSNPVEKEKGIENSRRDWDGGGAWACDLGEWTAALPPRCLRPPSTKAWRSSWSASRVLSLEDDGRGGVGSDGGGAAQPWPWADGNMKRRVEEEDDVWAPHASFHNPTAAYLSSCLRFEFLSLHMPPHVTLAIANPRLQPPLHTTHMQPAAPKASPFADDSNEPLGYQF
nr:unnamed protein product [Digitaria exilis]